MQIARKVCAVVPVKDARHAKARLAGVLSGAQRTQLAHAMLEDVLIALAATAADLDSILVVTVDRRAADIAVRYGAEPTAEHADAGHTAAVRAAAQRLESCGVDLLTLPADIPLVQPEDIGRLLAIHDEAAGRGGRLFGIVPARDGRGSNAIICSPAGTVPLQFGDSRKEAGVVRFEVLQQVSRPNHFSVVEIWKDNKAYDAHITAEHTRNFRERLTPMSGALYDERLYKAL